MDYSKSATRQRNSNIVFRSEHPSSIDGYTVEFDVDGIGVLSKRTTTNVFEMIKSSYQCRPKLCLAPRMDKKGKYQVLDSQAGEVKHLYRLPMIRVAEIGRHQVHIVLFGNEEEFPMQVDQMLRLLTELFMELELLKPFKAEDLQKKALIEVESVSVLKDQVGVQVSRALNQFPDVRLFVSCVGQKHKILEEWNPQTSPGGEEILIPSLCWILYSILWRLKICQVSVSLRQSN